MKKIIFVLAAMVSISSVTAFAGPVTDVCNKQVAAYMQNNVAGNVTSVYWQRNGGGGEGGQETMQAWVSVDSCTGYYVFNMSADSYTCFSQSHYGTIPNYILQVWTQGNCRRR
jgi:hypothetical protein